MSARSADNLITSLKVIAQLRQHERVCTRGEMIRVDRSGRGVWQSALRWLNDENRTHNLDHIDAIVQNALDTLGARADETEVHFRIDRELENTMRGIENLKITYEDCSVSTAKLDLILDKMRERSRVVAGSGGREAAGTGFGFQPRRQPPQKEQQKPGKKDGKGGKPEEKKEEEEEEEDYSSDSSAHSAGSANTATHIDES